MARTRVFVSSTYYDLKHIRASLESFIESLGFDAVLFEKGDIAFHPDDPLDESCYREAANSDIFVLIIGGRYGSASSATHSMGSGKPHDFYESITKKEFESAQDADVPTFILIDSAVAAEYQTYLRNKDSHEVKYAHVDSVQIFRMIEMIFEKRRNNPVFNFERANQIETWLREQWSGLFRELLKSRSQQRQIATLNSQVLQLKSVNETIKNYLEAVLGKISPEQSAAIITEEERRLNERTVMIGLDSNGFFRHLVSYHHCSEQEALDVISIPNNADEAVDQVDRIILNRSNETKRDNPLRGFLEAQLDFNQARSIIRRPELDFLASTDEAAASLAMKGSDHELKNSVKIRSSLNSSSRSEIGKLRRKIKDD